MKDAINLSDAISFLGVCSEATHEMGVTNIVGLTRGLEFPFFPQDLGQSFCVLAVKDSLQKPGEPINLKIIFRQEEHFSWREFTIAHGMRTPDGTISFDPKTPSISESSIPGFISENESITQIGPGDGRESVSLVVIPSPPHRVNRPGTIHVFLEHSEQSAFLGLLGNSWNTPRPLDDEERVRLANATSVEACAQLAIGCDECPDKTTFATFLMPADDSKYREYSVFRLSTAPDQWNCKCGKTSIDLRYAKAGLHEMFRNPHVFLRNSGKLFFPKQISDKTEAIIDGFNDLILSDPAEEQVQKYLENHPLFWSFLSPKLIIHKPRILTHKTADFGIHSSNGVFYFVEIEKPSTGIHLKEGGMAAEINKGADQIRDWETAIEEHRTAIFSELDVDLRGVLDVRFILIGGLASKYSGAELKKTKRIGAFGSRTTFYAFDEIGLMARLVLLRSRL